MASACLNIIGAVKFFQASFRKKMKSSFLIEVRASKMD